MLVVEKIEQGICCFCQEQASVKINGMTFCASCGDGELLKIMKRCAKAVQREKEIREQVRTDFCNTYSQWTDKMEEDEIQRQLLQKKTTKE